MSDQSVCKTRRRILTWITFATTVCSVLVAFRLADARTIRCLQAPRCTPPPCDYFRQLEMWSALKSVYESRPLRDKMRRDAARANPGLTGPALEEAAANLLDAEVRRQAARGGEIQRNLRECAGSPIPEPPSLRTTAECMIVDEANPVEPVSRERAHERYDTCSEFINAIFDHEDQHMQLCSGPNRISSTEFEHMGIERHATEEAKGYDAAIKRAKSGLQWWAATCANDIDRQTRRELTKQSVKLLGRRGR